MPQDLDSLVASLAKKLAHTDLTIRTRNLKVLTKWFSKKNDPLEEKHLMGIWKGLYYCMWMSDKPMVQHDLATQLAKLTTVFPLPENSFLFVRTFFLTMMREWIHIDLLRLDKFLTLVRKFFEESLRFLDKRGWIEAEVKQFCDFLLESPLNPTAGVNTGLALHIADIYLESLKKCLWKPIAPHKLKTMFELMLDVLKVSTDKTLVKRIYKAVFKALYIRRSVYCKLQLPFWLEFHQTILTNASSPDPSIRNKKELYKIYGLSDVLIEKIRKLEAFYEEQELEQMDDEDGTEGKEGKDTEEDEEEEEEDNEDDAGEEKKEVSDENKKPKERPLVFKVLDQDLDKRSRKRKRREEIAELSTNRPMKQLKLSVVDPNLKAISGRSQVSRKPGKKGKGKKTLKNGQRPQSKRYLDSVQKKKYFKAAKKEKSAKKKK